MSCDTLPGLQDSDGDDPILENLSINPEEFVFDAALDGQKDTTLNLSLKVDGHNLGENLPQYFIFIDDDDDPTYTGKLETVNSDGNTYEITAQINTSTYIFSNYKILVTSGEQFNTSNNYIISNIKQVGITLTPPEIVETNDPIEVQIPKGNEVIEVRFTAKVSDNDGLNNIENVYLNFENEDGSFLSAQPYVMMDDGKTDVSGDLVAGDNIYTKSFSIDKDNTPNKRTAFYWAVDKAGLSSDTLKVPFHLID